MKRLLSQNSPLVILSVLCFVLALISEDFRATDNLQNVAQRTCVIAIMAMGQVLVILTAGIDLSVGSVAALAGVTGSLAMVDWELHPALGVAIGTGTGLVCGVINGGLIAKGKIPPFIVTLGMMMAARGVAMVISGAKPFFGLPELFRYLGGVRPVTFPFIGTLEGWWVPVAAMLAIIIVGSAMLAFTRFGRSIYATGGNLQGARLSGINIDWVRIGVYSLSGACAGFAGMVHAARVGIGDPSAAEMYELDSIAACVIGGTSLMGGEGTGLGALAGALIMSVLVNFCNLNDINVHWQRVIVGALIIALVFYDTYRKRRAGLLKE